LEVIQNHIRALPPENIIDPGSWGSDFATEKLSNPFRSYVGREVSDQQDPSLEMEDYQGNKLERGT